MSNYYSSYGLYFETSRPLPHLVALTDLPYLDLSIQLEQVDVAPLPLPSAESGDWQPHPEYTDRREQSLPENTITSLRILRSNDGQFIAFRYYDDVQFIFSVDGSHIWGFWPKNVTFEYMVTYLMNPVLGFNLRLRHQVCLHASAVIVEEKALLVAGTSGAGKSTTAGCFAMRGHTVITDDISVLVHQDEQIRVYPGYPHLRLYGSSAEALTPEALPQLAPDWSKCFLDLQREEYSFAAQPTPVGAVYLLTGRDEQIEVQSMSPSEALIALMKNTYMDYLLDKEMRAADFKLLALLSQSVPVRALTAPSKLDSLAELYEAIVADYAACSSVLIEV
jgi:hypothetical protein